MSEVFNIAIIGQSGVGKSTLLNYLFDGKAKTGTGKPVTGKGFHEWGSVIRHDDGSEHKVKVFDSWGLEVGKHSEWNESFRSELKKRGVNKPPKDWFHSIIYCIAAGSNRVQDADIEIIKSALKEKYPVVIALTKADQISENDEKAMVAAIHKGVGSKLPVVPICGESKKTRAGETSRFGKEELGAVIASQIVKAIIIRVPLALEKRLSDMLSAWEDDRRSYIDDKVGYSNISDVAREIADSSEDLKKRMIQERKKILKSVFSSYGSGFEMLEQISHMEYRLPKEEGIYDSMDSLGEKVAFTLLAPLVFPIAAAWYVVKGRQDNRDDLKGRLNNFVRDIAEWIEQEVKNVKLGLKRMEKKN